MLPPEGWIIYHVDIFANTDKSFVLNNMSSSHWSDISQVSSENKSRCTVWLRCSDSFSILLSGGCGFAATVSGPESWMFMVVTHSDSLWSMPDLTCFIVIIILGKAENTYLVHDQTSLQEGWSNNQPHQPHCHPDLNVKFKFSFKRIPLISNSWFVSCPVLTVHPPLHLPSPLPHPH